MRRVVLGPARDDAVGGVVARLGRLEPRRAVHDAKPAHTEARLERAGLDERLRLAPVREVGPAFSHRRSPLDSSRNLISTPYSGRRKDRPQARAPAQWSLGSDPQPRMRPSTPFARQAYQGTYQRDPLAHAAAQSGCVPLNMPRLCGPNRAQFAQGLGAVRGEKTIARARSVPLADPRHRDAVGQQTT